MDLTTYTDAQLVTLLEDVRAEQNARAAQQQLEEDVRAAADRAMALGLDATTVEAVATQALTETQ